MDKRRLINVTLLSAFIWVAMLSSSGARPLGSSKSFDATNTSNRRAEVAGERPVGSSKSFEEFAHMIVTRLSAGDNAAIIRAASEHGVIVVRRQVDWNQSNKSENKPIANDGWTDNLSLYGLNSLVWTEHEVRFDKSELDEHDFHSILKQFHGLVRNTEDGYHKWGVIASLNLWDDWGSRYLGPAISGKIASNAFWYIYFTRVNGEWKIWRLEFVTH